MGVLSQVQRRHGARPRPRHTRGRQGRRGGPQQALAEACCCPPLTPCSTHFFLCSGSVKAWVTGCVPLRPGLLDERPESVGTRWVVGGTCFTPGHVHVLPLTCWCSKASCGH